VSTEIEVDHMIEQSKSGGRTLAKFEPLPSVSISPLRPKLISIADASVYLGGLSRSRIYELLPQLELVKIGARAFLTIDSIDRLIARHRGPASERGQQSDNNRLEPEIGSLSGSSSPTKPQAAIGAGIGTTAKLDQRHCPVGRDA
jgi:hypothetical protein